jgi:hypothetical protein
MVNIAARNYTHNHTAWEIWSRWTVITSVGEFIGFSVPAIVGAVSTAALGNVNNPAANLTMAATMILAGTCEGAILGLAQWLALRRYLPKLSQRAWVLATMAGAAVAWAIGMLPSALDDLTSLPLIILIGGGLVLGPTLLCAIGVAQYLVLCRLLPHVGWWIPASALAWLLGLMVVFVGMALIPDNASVPFIILIASLAGFGMGAVAAGVSGVALVRLLPSEASS